MTRQTRSKSSQPGLSWHGSHSLQEREGMIREAAYYRYLERGCCDGHDVEDWLDAEGKIDHGEAEPVNALPKQGVQQGGGRRAVSEETLKRAVKRHPRKAIPQVESIDPAEAPDRQ